MNNKMFENRFKKPVPQSKPKGEGCKIKIKNTSKGREISFEGQCTKEQLEMAKFGMNDKSFDVEED